MAKFPFAVFFVIKGKNEEMKIHELKITPSYFEDVIYNRKKFEVRRNDRGYKLDDYLWLREYDTGYQEYSGREVVVKIIYMLEDFVGLKENYVVLGISSPTMPPEANKESVIILDRYCKGE